MLQVTNNVLKKDYNMRDSRFKLYFKYILTCNVD